MKEHIDVQTSRIPSSWRRKKRERFRKTIGIGDGSSFLRSKLKRKGGEKMKINRGYERRCSWVVFAKEEVEENLEKSNGERFVKGEESNVQLTMTRMSRKCAQREYKGRIRGPKRRVKLASVGKPRVIGMLEQAWISQLRISLRGLYFDPSGEEECTVGAEGCRKRGKKGKRNEPIAEWAKGGEEGPSRGREVGGKKNSFGRIVSREDSGEYREYKQKAALRKKIGWEWQKGRWRNNRKFVEQRGGDVGAARGAKRRRINPGKAGGGALQEEAKRSGNEEAKFQRWKRQ
ncbi:hypothetical protein KM043_004093 [Ampulex compressa]|nr:hypothetical protein KM043_004093 [Ampulex compressa]